VVEPRSSTAAPRERDALSRHFSDDLGEGQIKEMWRRIDHAPRSSARPWLWATVAATAVLLLLLGFSRLNHGAEPRQLGLRSGAVPAVLSGDSQPSLTQFDDGSQVELASGTRLEVLRNDARSFVTALRRGTVTFDVKPGGQRHWVIEAGQLSVEVVGTRFRVQRGGGATRVSVERGTVVVRGERVPGGSVRLTAGKSFELPLTTEPGPEPRFGAPQPPATSLEPAPTTVSPGVVPSPSLASSSARAPGSAEPVAEPELEPTDEVARSLRAADAARHRSDSAAAIQHFEAAFRQAAPGDVRRGLAGLSLARLLLVAEPARAATILRSSLTDMPQALLEDASVRLVEAEGRAGHRDAAARAAADYLRRFPAGRRGDEVRRWSEP
jgi:transmembrane sensor